MEIKQVDQLRPLLFEALDNKVWKLYSATRSKKCVEEVREYLVIIMTLTREYIRIHKNDFRLRTQKWRHPVKATSVSPIQYMEDWCEPKNFRSILCGDSLRMTDIHTVRRWVWFVFDKILKLHCTLEWLDYHEQHNARYTYIWGIPVLKPWQYPIQFSRKQSNARWRSWISTWEYGFWSFFKEWSRESIARREYECIKCPHWIFPWQKYMREVFRMGEGLDIVRYHIECPSDPDDPNWWWRRDEDMVDQPSPIEDHSTKVA